MRLRAVRPATPARRSRWASLRRVLPAYLFLAPASAIILVFSFIAIGVSFYISFHQWGIISPVHPFVGLANYREVLFRDTVFWRAAQNTATFVVAFVLGTTVGALVLALVGNQAKYGRGIFRVVYFIPSLTPMVVLSLIWLWVYSPEGLMNVVLNTVGLPGPNWLMDERAAMPAVVMMSVWGALGYYMLLFMAGLADIPTVYFDAAHVDGASSWRTFWHVTLPLLQNTLILVVVVLTIGAFQVFTQVYVMTKGGPANATEVVQALIYKQAFESLRMGYASAMSWCLFVAIAVFTAIQMRVFRSQQIY